MEADSRTRDMVADRAWTDEEREQKNAQIRRLEAEYDELRRAHRV